MESATSPPPSRESLPSTPSSQNGNGTQLAGVFPSALTSEGVDGILYKGPTSPSQRHFQRKPPHLDFGREYHVAKSYRAARTTLDALTKQRRQQQITQEEAFDRDSHARKFTTQFAETRLATCGVPTVNDMSVIIARQRKNDEKTQSRPPQNQQQYHHIGKEKSTSEKTREAIRRALGTQTLDLKALELIHIPTAEVYTTMLMQFARMIRCVNVSRNALREIPTQFCASFPEAEMLIYKENALHHLPESLVHLSYLKHLNVECNQLLTLPTHLPTSLEVLVGSRNRLTQIVNLHELTRLVELDLSHNHLQVLPHGMMFLSKLKKLSLNGNRLVTLAMPPKQFVQDSHHAQTTDGRSASAAFPQDDDPLLDIEEAKKQWRVEVDPQTHDPVYFHLATKQITRTKPKCFQIHIPKLALAGFSAQNHETTQQHQQPRVNEKDVRKQHSDGWEIQVSEGNATNVQFVNHLTTEIFTSSIPPELDTLGDLRSLEFLSISGNQLLDLPPSIGRLVRLKRLEAEHNKLMSLPDTLQDLQALEVVKLGMNALSWLPPSFSNLTNLADLDLKLNRFQHLPDNFGKLLHLHSLDLSANSLESLPTSFLSLKRLATLKLQNNPQLTRKSGSFKPDTIAAGDIQQVMWQLQHQVQCELRGAQPPVPESVVVGVGDECWSTNIHLHKEFSHAITIAHSTRVLDFHWKNLTLAQFPPSFYTTLTRLQELRLSGHNLEQIPASFSCLVGLRVLHLRKNKIRSMDDNVFAFFQDRSSSSSELVELDLEYNQLETLPLSIGNLHKLRCLRVSNNRLTSVPESMGNLSTELKEVHLAHNRFQRPPPGLSLLLSLERLDLSYNQLTTLDAMEFTPLSKLTSLRVNVNQLVDLPESIGKTHLQELWIAGNKLVSFPSCILELKSTLTCLRMQSNKLYRLPVEFGELSSLEDVQSDGNPFRSPPPEVMTLGIRSIQKYLLKRQQRIQEITTLLTTNRFLFDPSSFRELKVRRLLLRQSRRKEDSETSTGKERSEALNAAGETSQSDDHADTAEDSLKFLAQEHLDAFDGAVDQYVNGHFYLLVDTRGADLVNDLLLQTQFSLAQRHRAQVLDELLKLCGLIKAKKWADKVDFRYDCDRPWGRHGELVGVFMVNPKVIFEDQAALPSICSVIKTRVHHGFAKEAFTRTQREVQDAIEHYVGLYGGPVGVVHDNVPFKCGCENLLRFNKMHEPCYRPGWTVLQVICTEEEVVRREHDETKIAEALQALRPQIETFLKTTEGEKRFHKEVKDIKDKIRNDLSALKKKVEKSKKKLKSRTKALEKRVKDEEKLLKKDPEAAAAAVAARSVADVKAREEEQEEVKRLQERVHTWTQEYEHGKAQLANGYSTFMNDVVTKLMEKVGAQVKNHLIQQQREKAIEFGWRRPWDGRNGREFEKYKQMVRRNMLEDGTMEKEDSPPPNSTAGDGIDDGDWSDNSEISDVSFDGYADLVSNANTPGVLPLDDDNEADTADREAALANLVVSDVSDDESNIDDIKDDSEDSEI